MSNEGDVVPNPAMVAGAEAAIKVGAPVIAALLGSFAKTLTAPVGQIAKNLTNNTVVALQVGFENYLLTSYNKCRHFKSILAPSRPLEVLDHYVNVSLTCSRQSVKDDDLIDNLLNEKHVVITGLAGSGKSMFMKYLTVRHFEQPKGVIPLFVELRHLNSLTDRKLLPFIRSSCTSKMHAVTQTQFELSLKSGALMLILDGFDELNHEYRDDVQSQILELQKDFPKVTVVVSSRPDPRFGGWTSFFVYTVDELSKPQTLKLIRMLEYDAGVKKRFLKAVDSNLYDSHRSFLSSPLLTSIMLLTFEEFAEIPQRMHEFYAQAFDTLLQKHDAQKEQYQRKTHTNITREDFKGAFAAFCALSYIEQKFSFKEAALMQSADSAVRYMNQTNPAFPKRVTGKQLVDDLLESVCMLQPDGIDISFVHRSFQEYFAALFVTNLHGSRVKQFLDKFCQRFDDSVIPMALDMSSEVVERDWVLPAIDDVEQAFWPTGKETSISLKYSRIFKRISLMNDGERIFLFNAAFDDQLLGQIESLSKLYPKLLSGDLLYKDIHHVAVTTYSKNLLHEKHARRSNYAMWKKFLEKGAQREPKRPAPMLNTSFTRADEWWLIEIGAPAVFDRLQKSLIAIRRDIQVRERRRSSILEGFFT